MPTIRVPYPSDPDKRKALFDKAKVQLAPYGTCVGNEDSGSVEAKTPLGQIHAKYQSPAGSSEIEIEFLKKPVLVPLAMIESQAKKFVEMA